MHGLVWTDPGNDIVGVGQSDLYMVSHIGDDDWLGHNSTVTAYADGDVVVVLSNSGYLDDGNPWSAEITKDIRGLLDNRNSE